MKNAMKAKKKTPRVTRRRTTKEVLADHEKDKNFRAGFSLALILHANADQDPANLEACFDVFDGAGYSLNDFELVGMDKADWLTLKSIFVFGQAASIQTAELKNFVGGKKNVT